MRGQRRSRSTSVKARRRVPLLGDEGGAEVPARIPVHVAIMSPRPSLVVRLRRTTPNGRLALSQREGIRCSVERWAPSWSSQSSSQYQLHRHTRVETIPPTTTGASAYGWRRRRRGRGRGRPVLSVDGPVTVNGTVKGRCSSATGVSRSGPCDRQLLVVHGDMLITGTVDATSSRSTAVSRPVTARA